MITFWIILSLMVLIALVFVLYPLWRNYQKKSDLITAFVSMSFIPTAALLLYFHWGNSGELAQYYALQSNAKIIANKLKQFKSPEQLIAKMHEILKQHPNSDRGWFLLGKLYFSMNDFNDAEKNYARANQLKFNQPEYMLAYAEASFLAHNKVLNTLATNYILQILQIQPKNPEALNLLALNAYSSKQYRLAIHYWEQLLLIFPPDTQSGQVIVKAIQQALGRIKHA